MKNKLPSSGPRNRESGIVYLDDDTGPGTHWVAYKKCGNKVVYFDSFGDLRPPKELMKYLEVDKIEYNPESHQSFNTFNCGHLCLKFLSGSI